MGKQVCVTRYYGSVSTLSRVTSELRVGSQGKAHRGGTVDVDGVGFRRGFGDELQVMCGVYDRDVGLTETVQPG